MKLKHIAPLCAGVIALTLTNNKTLAASGTDVLHLEASSTMINTGVETNASGVVSVQQTKQGNANNQRFDVLVKGLASNTTYWLYTASADETNLSPVTSFTTGTNGSAALRFRNHGGGKGTLPIPDALKPVSQVQEVDIFNSNSVPVLVADLTSPDQFQYLVKRNLHTNDVNGTLQILANTNRNSFSLSLTGLKRTTDYVLAINGSTVQTNTTDRRGRLRIDNLETNLPALQVNSVTVSDTSSNVVASTTLP
jgi:hypothetical protein